MNYTFEWQTIFWNKMNHILLEKQLEQQVRALYNGGDIGNTLSPIPIPYPLLVSALVLDWTGSKLRQAPQDLSPQDPQDRLDAGRVVLQFVVGP